MSLLRKIIKFISGFFFTTLLITTVVLFSLTKFTEYNNLKTVFSELFFQQIPQESLEQINQILSSLKNSCASAETIKVNYGGKVFVLNCSEVKNVTKENVENVLISPLLDEIYYKKYDCEFLSCLQKSGEEKLLVLISAYANNYFRNLFYISLIGTAIFSAIFFVSIETWSGRLRDFGITFAFIGLPFFILNYVKDIFVAKYLSVQVATIVSPIVNNLFNSMSNVYLAILIVGIVLTVAGYKFTK